MGAKPVGREGKPGFRGGTGDRYASHPADTAGSGVTDGGRRGDPTYRSAARHHAATPRKLDPLVC